jgi:hypothetical protein
MADVSAKWSSSIIWERLPEDVEHDISRKVE